ncbi:hypothetical protein F7725_011177, partial [Dissostichus mawsoni]
MLKRLERPSLMVVWTGLSRVVVERAHADSLLLFCGVVGVGALLLGRSALLLVMDGFLWSFGEPYFGEQHARSNLLWTTGEYWIFLVLRDGEEIGVPPPLGVRQRRSVCRPTLMVWVVCVPRVLSPLVWQAVSRTTGPGGDRIAFLTDIATSFMSSLMFLDNCSSREEEPTCPPPPAEHLVRSAGPPTFLPSAPGFGPFGVQEVWVFSCPRSAPPPVPLSGDFRQCSGSLRVLVVRVALVVRNQEAGGLSVHSSRAGFEPDADDGKSQPLLLNSSMYLRSSGDRGGVTSSWPRSSWRVLSGRNGELSINRWKSLMEHTDLALENTQRHKQFIKMLPEQTAHSHVVLRAPKIIVSLRNLIQGLKHNGSISGGGRDLQAAEGVQRQSVQEQVLRGAFEPPHGPLMLQHGLGVRVGASGGGGRGGARGAGGDAGTVLRRKHASQVRAAIFNVEQLAPLSAPSLLPVLQLPAEVQRRAVAVGQQPPVLVPLQIHLPLGRLFISAHLTSQAALSLAWQRRASSSVSSALTSSSS